MSDRTLGLNLFIRDAGYHEAAWRVSSVEAREVLEFAHFRRIAQLAERGRLDSIFLADLPGVAEFRTQFLPQSRFDPIQTLSALASVTDHIGLIATASTTYGTPWDLARRFATLDFLSDGRAGWNVVTTAEPHVAANFGNVAHPPRDDRYARALEFVDVTKKVWDGWDDDAVVADKTTGQWGRRAALHAPAHHGERYDVDGVLPFPRSPQGHPVLAQAGASPGGVALAARHANIVFTPQPTIEDGARFRARLRGATAANGRSPDDIKVLPGLSFVLGATEAEAREQRQALEAASSSEFRWLNLANMAGIDAAGIDPDAPFPKALLAEPPRTTFGATAYALVTDERITFRQVAEKFSSLPGGLDFTGTPEQFADLIETWFRAGASDGFTLMPMTLPRELELFVEHVVPILRARGLVDSEYRGRTLRDHYGLAYVPAPTR